MPRPCGAGRRRATHRCQAIDRGCPAVLNSGGMNATPSTSQLRRPAHLFAEPRSAPLDQCVWYHVMDVPGVGITDGPWDLRGKFSDYIGGVPVAGKSVLDIG